jgi:uncharacterized protein YdaU (DUF1376 family)
MSKAPAFQYYAKDHIATKASLTMEERGAWSTLVDHCWENGAPISMSLAVRLVGEKQIESLRFLLRIEGDLLTFDWMEETRAKQAERSHINATNGKLGGRGNTTASRKKSERKANGKRLENEKKPFRAEDEVEDNTVRRKERANPLVGFDAFWEVYAYKKARPDAERAWAKMTEAERTACMDGLPSFVKATFTDGRFPARPFPATFLNGKRWTDEITAPTPTGLPQHKLPEATGWITDRKPAA